MSKSKLMFITCRLIFLELKKRYSVLLRLADNLFASKPGRNIFDARIVHVQGKMKYMSIIRIKMMMDARVFGNDRMEWGGIQRVE